MHTPIALHNLMHGKWRTVVSTSGVALAIILVFLTVSLCFFYLSIRHRDESQHLLIDSKKELVGSVVSSLTTLIETFYSTRIHNLTQIHQGVIQALAARDREQLYLKALPVYRVLRQENRYFEHLSFLLPDNTIFLSVQEQGQQQEHDQECLGPFHSTSLVRPSAGPRAGVRPA